MPPSNQDLEASLSKTLDNILSSHSAPSIALAIAFPTGSHIIAKGTLKHGSQTPITPSSLYMLGPLTSTFIPLILSRLIAQNLFTWNSKITSLLPNIQIHHEHQETTLEMLARHITGITTKLPEIDHGALASELMNLSGYKGRHKLVTTVLVAPPDEKPGTDGYRNAINLLILAFIAETATKKSWEELLKLYIFDIVPMPSAGLGRPGPEAKFEGCPFPHTSPKMVLGEGITTPWLDCKATYPALGVSADLGDVISYLRFCVEEERRDGAKYELAPGGKFVKAGFDVLVREGKGDVLQCKGHVSGFATGVLVAGDVAWAVFVNLDGVEGAEVRDEVGRVVMDMFV
ncbi:hypothetical protein Vi05172_g10158 [Venturia inaequalis]|nr:hypothetical protein Vi05172_g10158 [Venturia inaequalis]